MVVSNDQYRQGPKRTRIGKMGKRKAGKLLCCGVISGTSRDGIDVAIVEIEGTFPRNKLKQVHSQTLNFPSPLRRRLLSLSERACLEEIAALDFLLGQVFAASVLKTIESCGLEPSQIDVIGSHGQTVLHRSQGVRLAGKRVKATCQIANGGVIAALTGIPTVSDFRAGDIAAGGEGAPLVPILDYALFSSKAKTRIGLNIGGISNITVIPRGGHLGRLVAFDCGPGNCVIDIAVRYLTKGRKRYDIDGRIASKGEADAKEVRRILRHPYFCRRPPKSAGWFEFGEDFTLTNVRRMGKMGLSMSQIVRTLTEVSIQAIVDSLKRFVYPYLGAEELPIDEVIVTGGGSRNPVIMDSLRERLKPTEVLTGEDVGINSDTKEAVAFAYLAYLRLMEIPANIVTQNLGGKPAILGALYLP